jgi:predicted DNA-binding protein (UPF0251 family)
MTTLTYNLSRQQAADHLGISTRTVDRYVKSGKLSYKKVANKVILSTEEIADLQNDFALLQQQEAPVQVTRERSLPIEKMKQSSSSLSTGNNNNSGIKEFAEILTKKDQTIEEKNQLIFALQRKLGELETQMKQMIALPDHSSQKEELATTIQELEKERVYLQEEIKKEKLWNAVYIGLVLIAAVMILFFTFLA